MPVDLGQMTQQRVVEAPPQPAFFANDAGVSVLANGMVELRFRYVGQAGQNVQTVVSQPVVLPAGVVGQLFGPHLVELLAAAARQMAADTRAMGQMVAELVGTAEPQNGGQKPSPEEMARRRREAGG